eukprot:243271-Rhodomonas_salina.2
MPGTEVAYGATSSQIVSSDVRPRYHDAICLRARNSIPGTGVILINGILINGIICGTDVGYARTSRRR